MGKNKGIFIHKKVFLIGGGAIVTFLMILSFVHLHNLTQELKEAAKAPSYLKYED